MRSRHLELLLALFTLAIFSCSDDSTPLDTHDSGADAQLADGITTDGIPATDGAPLQTHKKKVEDLVKPIVDGAWTMGLVVGLVSSAGTEIYAFGKRAAGDAAPDGDTLFEIGSVTKTFTSLALASMIKDGEVTLTQQINTLLPAGKVKVPGYSGQEVNLLQLATHTSGLPRMPSNFSPKDAKNPYIDYTTPLLYAFLNGYTLPRAPGSKWEYSNLATGVLGHALALKENKSYEALIGDRITKVLALKDTAIKLSADQSKRTAKGYDHDLVATSAWDFDVLAPCGAIRSTAKDMLTYLEAQAGLTSSSLDAPMAETHKVHYSDAYTMGLGWIHNGTSQRWHNGGTYGFETFAGFDKQKKVGVIVLSNALTAYSSQTLLGQALMAMMTGQSYQAVNIPPTITLTAAALNAYAGTYTTTSGSVGIQLTSGALYLVVPSQGSFRIYPSKADTFYLRVSKTGLTFTKDSSGKVTTMELSNSSGKTTFTKAP